MVVLLGFTFGDGNKVFDLYQFTSTSLKKACDDFKIKNAKGEFDHKKVKTWQDTEIHKNESLAYLKLDVTGLKELFEKFNNAMYKKFKTNITKFVTLSHMAYELWCSMLDDVIEIPKDMERYLFIKEATYGARTAPQKMEYISKHYDDIVNGRMTHAQLVKTLEYVVYLDASSLYPASMKGFKLCKVAYPIGFSRWSEKGQEEYDAGKVGIYTIKYSPPKNIRVPVLPRRIIDGGVYGVLKMERENMLALISRMLLKLVTRSNLLVNV